LANIKRVDFAGLSRELAGLLGDVRKRLEGVDLKGVSEQWKKTGADVQALVASPEVKRTLVNLDGAITDLRGVLAKIDGQVGPAGKELTETLSQAKIAVGSLNDASTAARKFLSTHSGLGDEVVGTLSQLNEAAAAVTRLADFLERNPNALLTGKKRPQ
jgi:paraquat-inducible protein B